MKEKVDKLPTRIAVRAIIINDEQNIMLVKRAPGNFEGDKWCLAGGKPDEDEELDKAVTREIQEEVGVQVQLTYFAEIENPDTSTGVRWITHYFVGVSNDLPTQFNTREVSEVAFFSQEELEELDMAFDHKDVLMRYLKENG